MPADEGAAQARAVPEISVVVCSHNGASRLPDVLGRLRHQSLERSRYELIVVDDGSTDGTAEVASAHGARVVRLSANRGLACARNTGTRAARGGLVAFTDDDCEPAEDWLIRLLSAFADPAVDGVSGRIVPACDNAFLLGYLSARNPLAPLGAELLASAHPIHRLRLYLRRLGRAAHEPGAGARLYSLVGANMALRRGLILELGGFDPAIAFGGEEEELCLRAHARRDEAMFIYEPAATVVHRFAPRLTDPVRRSLAYGRGHPYVMRKHPSVRLVIYPFPVLLALAILLGLVCGRTRLAAGVAAGATVAYPRWPAQAWQRRSPRLLLYAYLELAEEVATMLGELQGTAQTARGQHGRTPTTCPG